MKEDFNNYLDLIRLRPETIDLEVDSIFRSAFLELCDECSDFNIWCSYTYLNVIKTHKLYHDKFPDHLLLITRDGDTLNSTSRILISETHRKLGGIPFSNEWSIPINKDALKEIILKWFNSMISLIMNKK